MRLQALGAGVLALIVAHGLQNPPSSTRSMTQVPARSLPLQTVASVLLPGGSSRFDYHSLDKRRHLLFSALLIALGPGSEPAEPAKRVIPAAGITGVVTMLLDLFV